MRTLQSCSLKPLRANEIKFGQLFTRSTQVVDFKLSSLPGIEYTVSKNFKRMETANLHEDYIAPVFEDSKNKRSTKGQFVLTDTSVCLNSTCLLPNPHKK